MSTRNLEAFFDPRSITVVGASEAVDSLGGMVLRNLIQAGFSGPLNVLNRRDYDQVHGRPCYKRASSLPQASDLAIICTPPKTVPRLVKELGRIGVRAAIINVGGFTSIRSRSGRKLLESLHDATRRSGIRILGPNSLGLIATRNNLNASFSHLTPGQGEIAYVGESAVLGSAMLDWAYARGIGFSHFLTLGNSSDVDMDDVVDYLASDWRVRSILLHIEHIRHGRRFMSAMRAAARGKLLLVIKSSSSEQEEPPPPAGINDRSTVYDTVFQRAGMMQVATANEFFGTLETLTRMKRLRGERLAIISNGAGPGLLACDALIRSGLKPAVLSNDTEQKLKAALHPVATTTNPIDLSALATAEDYVKTLDILAASQDADAFLALQAPGLSAQPEATATAVTELAQSKGMNLLTSWLGEHSMRTAREHFDTAEIPTYSTPERAVEAFAQMVAHQRARAQLRQTPEPAHDIPASAKTRSQAIIEQAYSHKRNYLNAQEVRELVASYGIPVAHADYADSIENIEPVRQHIDGPVSLKIIHGDLCHPYSGGGGVANRWRGVVMDLDTAEQTRLAAERMLDWAREHYPTSPVHGFLIQPMRRGRRSLQINIGITHDPVFGPMLVFGPGGPNTTRLTERRLALPPLNLNLAQSLVDQSEIHQLLLEASGNPEARINELCHILVHLSQIAVDHPQLHGLEINPLVFDREGVLALDMMADLMPQADQATRLAISPYPEALIQQAELKDGTQVTVRPIRAEDEPAHRAFHEQLSPETLRFRYFVNRKSFRHEELAQMTQIDYDREMVFIATQSADNEEITLGEVRAWSDADNLRAEFSLLVRDDQRGLGLGSLLMRRMLDYCKSNGTLQVVGTVLPDNKAMLGLASKMKFQNVFNEKAEVIEIRVDLNEPEQDWQKRRLDLPVA